MATLTGQKIKDAYQTLLKLESGTLTGSTKIVEDGAGNDSALKLSTTEVEVDGALTFTSAPPASATELTALLIDGATNDVVTRELNAIAFTGGVSVATPIVLSGGNVTLDDAANLSQLTSSASDDKFLLWDESASVWKYISYQNLYNIIAPQTYIPSPIVVGRVNPIVGATTTPTYLRYALDGSSDADSISIGNAIGGYYNWDNTNGTRSGVQVIEDGTYRVDISLEVDTTTSNTDLTIEVLLNGTVEMKATRTGTSVGINTTSFFQTITANGGDALSVRVTRGSSGACSVTLNSIVEFQKL